MTTSTNDFRLSDEDLTVLVEEGAKKMATLAFNEDDIWDSITPELKNRFREEVLPIIFASTKRLKELGYFKPYLIIGEEDIEKVQNEGVIIQDVTIGHFYIFSTEDGMSGWWNGPFRYSAVDFGDATFKVISEGI